MAEVVSTTATVNVPKDVIAPIIEAKVSQVLIEALGDKGKIMEEAVKQVLLQRVNHEGKHENYDSYNKLSYVQWLVEKSLKEAISAAVVDAIAAQKDQVRKIVGKQLANQKGKLIQQIADALIGRITSQQLQYAIKVEVLDKVAY